MNDDNCHIFTTRGTFYTNTCYLDERCEWPIQREQVRSGYFRSSQVNHLAAVLRGHAQDCLHYNTSIVQQGIRAIVLDIQRTMEHPLSQLLEYADTSAKRCPKEVLSISLCGLQRANRTTLRCGLVGIVPR